LRYDVAMPKWLKILLFLFGGGILAFGLLVGGVVWWASANKDRLVEGTQTAQKEGKRYGETHAKNDCIDDALNRVKTCGMMDFVCEAQAKIRMTECMSVASEDGTCKSAPSQTEIFKIATWANQECANRGYRGSQPCARLLQGVVQGCAQSRR
jgi:hypothetical protein